MSEKKKSRLAIVVVAVVVIAGGAIAYFTLSSAGDAESTTSSANVAADEAGGTEIAVVEATPGAISVRVEGPSVVEPYRSQDIRSRVAGTVAEAAGEGDAIEPGGILVRFDDTDLRSVLRQAELNLEQARVDLQRAEIAQETAQGDLADKEILFAAGSIPRNQRDAARDAASNADLTVSSARIKVDQSALSVQTASETVAGAVVTAPFSGVVLQSSVGPGDVVSSGSVIMTFADLTRLRLRAEVDEFDIGKVQPGMAVEITADALGKESLRSTVERVSPAAEVVNNISIFTVSTVVRANDGILRPGMSADLSILISDDTGLIVPSNAVSSVRGRFYLDVFENDEVVTKRVVAGANDGVNVVITEGLEEGELVVIPQTAGFTLGPGATSTTGTSIIPVTVPGSGGSR